MLQSESVHIQMAVLSVCFVFKDFVLFFSLRVKRGKKTLKIQLLKYIKD